jgi:hypothetical protein
MNELPPWRHSKRKTRIPQQRRKQAIIQPEPEKSAEKLIGRLSQPRKLFF